MEARADRHPTDRILHDYGLGKLDDRAAEAVERHLESCRECRARAGALSGDSFLGKLQDAHKAGAATPPPAQDTLPPELANHPDYEIVRELGRGGMGVVYLANNRLMGRLEILKVVRKQLISRQTVVDRFLREIRSAAKLQHANIVAAYSAMRFGDSIVLAMEYVDGLDLARLVKTKGPLPVAHAAYFVHQAALGVQHAHERGMVHRDIKPANLILANDGRRAIVKVLDFGLAKVTSETPVDGGLTQDGQMLGTPDFIAPEQTLDAQKADIRADIYSLGCTLYYLLTGGPPFRAPSLYEVLQAHHSVEAKPLNLVRPEVPVELAAIAARMMAKDPARRYQTPAEVAQALTPFFKVAARNATVESPSAKATPIATAAPETTAPVPTKASPRNAGAAGVVWESLIEFKQTEFSPEEPPRKPPVSVVAACRKPWLVTALVAFVLLVPAVAWIAGRFSREPRDTTIVQGDSPVNAGSAGDRGRVSAKSADKAKEAVASGPSAEAQVAHAPAPLVEAQPAATAQPLPDPPAPITNSIGMKLVRIPAGEFMMGAPDAEKVSGFRHILKPSFNDGWMKFYDWMVRAAPSHRVRLTKPWLMGVTEVTVGQFERFVQATGHVTEAEQKRLDEAAMANPGAAATAGPKIWTWRDPSYRSAPEHPVTQVSWNDAVAFCNWLSNRERLTPCYVRTDRPPWTWQPQGDGYRLPTEAEWEYACRAGGTYDCPVDDDFAWLKKHAWYAGNSNGSPRPVRGRPPNTFGLFDMLGNVYEWCNDSWDEEFYTNSPLDDPLKPPSAGDMVQRGGWWNDPGMGCQPWFRNLVARGHSGAGLGFRVVRVSMKPPADDIVASPGREVPDGTASALRNPEPQAPKDRAGAAVAAGMREPAAPKLPVVHPIVSGLFGFPQPQATVLCDDPRLRLSVWNDSRVLCVQAMLRLEKKGTPGKKRTESDWAELRLDVDANGRTTPQYDRHYALLPNGFHYTVCISDVATTPPRNDSTGRGAIRLLPEQGAGGRLRVDTFAIPLSELGRKPGEAIGLAYYGDSPNLRIPVGSVAIQRQAPNPTRAVPVAEYHSFRLEDRPASFNLSRVPDDR